MAILLIAEHDNATLSNQTAKALSEALQIGSDVHMLVAGTGAKRGADAATSFSKARLAKADEVTERLAEPLAPLVISIAGAYDTIMRWRPRRASISRRAAVPCSMSRRSSRSSESPRSTCSSNRSMPATPSRRCSRPTTRR